MEEYQALMAELEQTPPALEYTLTRAQAKHKKTRRRFTVPAASLLGVLTAFVLAVNLSTPFARAVSHLPLLGDLARLVSFSPSLSAAVEHDYVQPVGQEQTANGITMRVEYLIADQKQLNIFFSLSSDQYTGLDGWAELYSADPTEELTGFGLMSRYVNEENGQLRKLTADFNDGYTVPESLVLKYRVWDRQSMPEGKEDREDADPLAVFTFPLTIDPAYVRSGKIYALNQDFTLDGQTLTALNVEIYPSHLRLNLADHQDNTAWLRELEFHLTDEKGNRFDSVTNGVSGSGSPDSPFQFEFRLESPWFYEAEELSIVITGAEWLDKDKERVEVDLANGAAQWLPNGVVLHSAQRMGNSWDLTFAAPYHRESFMYDPFRWDYYDPDGGEHRIERGSSGTSGYVWDQETQSRIEYPGCFIVKFSLEGYPYDTVYLCPSFSHRTTLAQPVIIEVD